MSASHTVSASFTNVRFILRVSWLSGYPSDLFPVSLTPDLIWYKCNASDIGVNTIKNYATNVSDTTVGNPTISTQYFKTRTSSLQLNGTQYIIPQALNFGNFACTTFCCWFKFKPSQSPSTYIDFLVYTPAGTWASSYILDFCYDTGIETYINGQQIRNSYSSSLTNDMWYLIAYVGGGVSTTMTIYMNGQVFVSYSSVPYTTNLNTNYHWLFYNPWDHLQSPIGYVNDVRFYGRSLNASEVLMIYNASNN